MKNRFIYMCLIVTLSSFCISGCGSKEAEVNKAAYREMGINCMKEDDYEGAIEAFQSALDQSLAIIGESEIDTCYYKAMAQYEAGKPEDAIETYTSLIKYDSKNATAYFLRGNLYLNEQNTTEAVNDYDMAAKYAENDYEMYIQIYNKLSNARVDTDAEGYLKEALDISGKKVEDYTQKGRIYVLLKDYDSAKEQLDQAIDQGSTTALLYMGQVYEAQGDTDKAQRLYESYVKDNAVDTVVLNSLGCMQMEDGDYAEAATYFEMALKTDNPSNEQELRRNLILAYEYAGNFTSAKDTMTSYIADYPDDKETQRENLFLQTR